MNIAACDNLPAVLLHAPKGQEELEAKAAKLAWSEEFMGRFVWAAGEAKGIGGAKPGLIVVQPGKYGDKGKVLAHAAAEADGKALAEARRAGTKKHVPDTGEASGHVKSGRRAGVFYEPPNPVTDPMEKAARGRGKSKRKREGGSPRKTRKARNSHETGARDRVPHHPGSIRGFFRAFRVFRGGRLVSGQRAIRRVPH
ncbi:MAG: hypothetical protein K2W96_20125 [Gemmataceae bacterium]|nr:hypothetical protein [Gemmataceae bacterium]